MNTLTAAPCDYSLHCVLIDGEPKGGPEMGMRSVPDGGASANRTVISMAGKDLHHYIASVRDNNN